jgi:aldehyde dehydrogenase (NAD+)
MTANIKELVRDQREFFTSGATRDTGFRVSRLRDLKRMVEENQTAIEKALAQDLAKPASESRSGEISPLLAEADLAIEKTPLWSRTKKVATPEYRPAAASYVMPEPLGVVLIIAPWNYPLSLNLSPLIGAMAAGNCAVLKPSELAPASSHLVAELVQRYFEPSLIAAVEGGAEQAQALLDERFDHIFYTGGPATGKKVMEAAARHLTPLTLELGGKCPCIVEDDADIAFAARRITRGKFFNAGQTCIAPDYLLVHAGVKQRLLSEIAAIIGSYYGEDPKSSPRYGRIVNANHFDRIMALLDGHAAVTGGDSDRGDLYISPTLIDGVSADTPLMQEEIFGPVLPVVAYTDLGEAIAFVASRPKPLALYFFSASRTKQRRVLAQTTCGGCCINDVMAHYANPMLPFGGVGASGFGRYHGRAGFDAFSNLKSVLSRSNQPAS